MADALVDRLDQTIDRILARSDASPGRLPRISRRVSASATGAKERLRSSKCPPFGRATFIKARRSG